MWKIWLQGIHKSFWSIWMHFFWGEKYFWHVRPFRTKLCPPILSIFSYLPPVNILIYSFNCLSLSTQSPHLKRGLSSGLFPIGSSLIVVSIFESFFLQACPTNNILLFAASLDLNGLWNKFWNCSLYRILYFPVCESKYIRPSTFLLKMSNLMSIVVLSVHVSELIGW